MKIWYCPLEPYRERYTEQLLNWTQAAFARNNIEYEVVLGHLLSRDRRIALGPVLDAHGRSYWSLTQMAALVSALHRIDRDDWIFIEDFFTPGYEALPYIFDQQGWRPRIATRNYAQSMDPDDFTASMVRWMRPYERMVEQTADIVFVASMVHKELCEIAGVGSNVRVIGLPFDSVMVRRQGPEIVQPWHVRPWQVVYASRLDREKQPHFFMDIVERCGNASIGFDVCLGSDAPRSNDPTVVPRLQALADKGRLRIHAGLTKSRYYAVLAQARVQLNTARQDFVSFTALEASAFGVPTLAPAFRSFPEALENRHSQLYTPWSVDDALLKLYALIDKGEPQSTRLVEHHDKTFDRMIGVFNEHRR